MLKRTTITGIIAVVVLFGLFGTTPDENVTDSKSAIKNAANDIKTNQALDASKTLIDEIGTQSVENACDGNGQLCGQAKLTYATGIVTISIVTIALAFAGIIGFLKWLGISIN